MTSKGLPSSEILALPFHKSFWPLGLVFGLFSLTPPLPTGSQIAEQHWELGSPVHKAQGRGSVRILGPEKEPDTLYLTGMAKSQIYSLEPILHFYYQFSLINCLTD